MRRPPWRVLVAAPAVFFSPLTTPLFSPWRWRAAMRKISVRGAKNSCAPARLKTGGLVAGVARALAAFAATVRKRLASRPLAVRAPLAAPCAPSRAFARRSPPSSGGQARVVKGVQSSSVSAWGTGTRLRRSDRRLTAAIKPESTKKAPALTKSGGIGRFPTPKRPAERPKMGCQRSSRRRSARYGSLWPREAT